MAENSKIEWTDNTANFWWGCFKVSPGCQHCYADTLAKRYGKAIWGPAKTTDRELKKGIWKELPKWNEQAKSEGIRRRVFVQSMADFFEDHPQVVDWRRDALHLISQLKNLDFQILTKRPENINRMIEAGTGRRADAWFADCSHVWIGTSVENQVTADERTPELLKVPAAVRFLSMEPLLGAVDLNQWLLSEHGRRAIGAMPGISWAIVGGESGHNARAFDLSWAYSIVSQCEAAGVPVFMKQFGNNPKSMQWGYKITGKGGDWNEWPVDLRVRQFPQAVQP
jgi:protein gp37